MSVTTSYLLFLSGLVNGANPQHHLQPTGSRTQEIFNIPSASQSLPGHEEQEKLRGSEEKDNTCICQRHPNEEPSFFQVCETELPENYVFSQNLPRNAFLCSKRLFLPAFAILVLLYDQHHPGPVFSAAFVPWAVYSRAPSEKMRYLLWCHVLLSELCQIGACTVTRTEYLGLLGNVMLMLLLHLTLILVIFKLCDILINFGKKTTIEKTKIVWPTVPELSIKKIT